MTDRSTLILPSDGTACGQYRMILPGLAIAAQGKPVIVKNRAPQIVVDQDGRVRGIETGNYQNVIFQRPASYQFSQVIPILQDKGVKIILDMDDSLSTIDPRNTAFKTYDPRTNRERNWMHAAKACEIADLVTVATPALAEEYGSHGRVVIIPNFVPESYLKIERPVNESPVVVWAGYTATHIDDLAVTKGIINQVLIDTGAIFAAFGDLKIFTDLQIRNRPPHQNWNFVNFKEYPSQLVKADIGLVPLKKSKFNQAKSALKILEYASLGVVPVASPTEDNMRLIDRGIGIKAETPRDWYDRVKELIVDNDYRLELSQKIRNLVADHTIEANTDLWWKAWSEA